MNVECVVSIIIDSDSDSAWMKKGKKSLIASLFKWIGFSWSKVRWQTNMAVLLLDFLYETLKILKKSMVKTMAKTMEIDLMIATLDL